MMCVFYFLCPSSPFRSVNCFNLQLHYFNNMKLNQGVTIWGAKSIKIGYLLIHNWEKLEIVRNTSFNKIDFLI